MEFDSTLILIIVFALLTPLVLFGLAFAWFVYTEDWPIKQTCLRCGERELRIIDRGKWDGINSDGKRAGGWYAYAKCKHCGACCENNSGKWELVEEERAKDLERKREEMKARIKRIEEKNRAYNARKKLQ